MGLMAQKLDASLALEGQFSPKVWPRCRPTAASLTMEFAKSLVETSTLAMRNGNGRLRWVTRTGDATGKGRRLLPLDDDPGDGSRGCPAKRRHRRTLREASNDPEMSPPCGNSTFSCKPLSFPWRNRHEYRA